MANDDREAPAEIRYTANFAANLASIKAFWDENEFPQGYDRLLDDLTDVVLSNLERHSRMGRPFLSRQPESVEAQTVFELLQRRLASYERPTEIREYVMDDYLVLYSVHAGSAEQGPVVHLLAVKHHKKSSFYFEL